MRIEVGVEAVLYAESSATTPVESAVAGHVLLRSGALDMQGGDACGPEAPFRLIAQGLPVREIVPGRSGSMCAAAIEFVFPAVAAHVCAACAARNGLPAESQRYSNCQQ